MNIFERIALSVMSNSISLTFLILIVALFIVFLFYSFIKPEHANSLGRVAPGFLTIVGVVGTFLGIFVGLLDFDVENIDASVPDLLEGLKAAFFTSIAGMTAALLWKGLQIFLPGAAGDITEDDPARAYRLLEEIKEENSGIRQAISGEKDSSLVTQMQKLRDENRDGNEKIITAFQDFAKQVADNSVKAIIEALDEVIRDFNNKLSEQFGENFARFNEAMGKILIWQEDNQQRIQELTNQFTRTTKGITETRDALVEIAKSVSTIPPVVEDIRTAVGTLENQNKELQILLENISTLGEDARAVIPQIEENINRLTKGFSDHVDQTLTSIRDTVSETGNTMRKMTAEATEDINKITQGFTHHVNQSLTTMNETVGTIGESMKKAVQEYASELSKIAEDARKIIADNTNQIERLIQESISKFDSEIKNMVEKFLNQFNATMEEEVQRVITYLGRSLAAITQDIIKRVEQFTADRGRTGNDIGEDRERRSGT